MDLTVATGIVVFTYLIIEILKKNVAKDDHKRDYLPFAGVLIGAALALLIFVFDKSLSLGIYVGDNMLTALVTGAGSGLVATGGNQLFKKIKKLLKGDYKDISPEVDDLLNQVEDLNKEE